jgi:hypothetical protein
MQRGNWSNKYSLYIDKHFSRFEHSLDDW